MTIQKRKNRHLKRDINKSESIRQYHKGKYLMNQTFEISYQKAKYQNFIKKIRYQKCQEKKKGCDKVQNFPQQAKQGTCSGPIVESKGMHAVFQKKGKKKAKKCLKREKKRQNI